MPSVTAGARSAGMHAYNRYCMDVWSAYSIQQCGMAVWVECIQYTTVWNGCVGGVHTVYNSVEWLCGWSAYSIQQCGMAVWVECIQYTTVWNGCVGGVHTVYNSVEWLCGWSAYSIQQCRMAVWVECIHNIAVPVRLPRVLQLKY